MLANYKAGKVLDAIGKLETSIKTRKKTKRHYDSIGYSETDNPEKHEYRISFEEELLDQLKEARANDIASRPKKKKKNQPGKGGWITVGN